LIFAFTPEARSQLRAIDRAPALRIRESIHQFGASGAGDVEPLHGEWRGYFRLRAGDYRIIICVGAGGIQILVGLTPTAATKIAESYWPG
jgi:mRNA-degrading endonuclease RelE of RelBE toxin-antitoxin system